MNSKRWRVTVVAATAIFTCVLLTAGGCSSAPKAALHVIIDGVTDAKVEAPKIAIGSSDFGPAWNKNLLDALIHNGTLTKAGAPSTTVISRTDWKAPADAAVCKTRDVAELMNEDGWQALESSLASIEVEASKQSDFAGQKTHDAAVDVARQMRVNQPTDDQRVEIAGALKTFQFVFCQTS